MPISAAEEHSENHGKPNPNRRQPAERGTVHRTEEYKRKVHRVEERGPARPFRPLLMDEDPAEFARFHANGNRISLPSVKLRSCSPAASSGWAGGWNGLGCTCGQAARQSALDANTSLTTPPRATKKGQTKPIARFSHDGTNQCPRGAPGSSPTAGGSLSKSSLRNAGS